MNRIKRIDEILQKAIGGDTSERLNPSGKNDAIDKLIHSINRMVEVLNAHIDSKKETETAFNNSEEKYRRLEENIPGMIYQFAMHPDGTFSFPYVNAASKELFGISPEDLMGDSNLIIEKIHPGDRERFESSVKRSAETLKPCREVLRLVVDGEIRWYDCISRPELQSNSDTRWNGIILEITEHKLTEEALRDSEQKFRSIAEQSSDVIALTGVNGVISYVSPSSEQLFGFQPDQMVGHHFIEFLDESSVPIAIQKFGKAVKEGHHAKNLELLMKRKDGSRFYGELTGSLFNPRSNQGNLSVIIRDITNRKRDTEKQKKLQGQLANAVEMAYLGPWEYDVSKDLFLFNDYFYNIFRTSANEVGGYKMSSEEYTQRFVHPEDRSIIREETRKAVETDDPHYSRKLEHRILYPDGSVGYITVRFFVVKDVDGKTTRVIGANQDITDHKLALYKLRESEEKLARSRKMESLGLLAGGVAHDLNNVLSGIVSYPDLLLINLPEDSKLRKPIQTIQASGNRAVAIVQDLLTIARGVASPKETLNLNDIVKEYLASPEFEKAERFHSGTKVRTLLDKGLMNIKGSPIHIRKVVMNLVVNALEAIEDKGVITITTANRYVDRPIKGYEDVKIGEYVVLGVHDDGLGISPDHLERIFEPFFTKKIMGRSGTGLGLSVVWNIVQDHDGYVDISSGDKGTDFRLYFPISRNEMAKNGLFVSLDDCKGKGEMVLVVDDMENQREITCNMLDLLGYQSTAVSGGEEAVEYLKDHSMDIVLLDMIMDPGINGRETYERIIKIHPRQKAIILSGFAETDEVMKAQALGAGQFLRKPLTLKKLGMALKTELEK